MQFRFLDTTPAVNQEFVRKSQKNYRFSWPKSWDVNHAYASYPNLLPNVSEVCLHCKRENGQAPAKKDRLY